MWKYLRYAGFAILVVYAFLAIGLASVNWLIPKARHGEESIFATSKEAHQFTLIDSGMQSFFSRLRLIESAKRSLELEFFIYNVDESSRIFTQALIAKAKAGVKIRLLVDVSGPVFQLKPVYARYLRRFGIEVRYYNTSAFYRLVTIQHRSHRKLLIADGEAMITGGRNIGNEYFDLSPKYNFLDTDVEVRGPIVQPVLKSFDLYWKSELSREVEDAEKPLDEDELKLARKFLDPAAGDAEMIAKVTEEGGRRAASSPVHICRDLTFVTDFPNQGENNRRVYKAIVSEIAKAKTDIDAESPYFVIRKDGYEVMRKLRQRGLNLRFLTNSLHSTDAFYTVASLFFNLRWLADTGMEIYAYDGSLPGDGQASAAYNKENRWGVHSKRAVIDGETSMIGTYNIDPRSANLNSELMVICRGQRELAAEMLKHMQARKEKSRPVALAGRARWVPLIEGASFGQKLLLAISLPIANLFDFLL